MLEQLKVPEKDRIYVPVDQMRRATEAVFRCMELSEDDAALATDVLMSNDLRGMETHGVSNMLRSYVAAYRAGRLNPRGQLSILRESPTTALIDGDNALGLHIAPRAMDIAIEKAQEFGMGSVCVRNVGHMGGCGYHAMRALPHDMIGAAMTASGIPSVLPTYGAEPRMGTNPLGWAAPAGEMPPFVTDIGTAQIAHNKVRLARRVGAQIEPGWIATADGTPIMERIDIPEEYHLLPLGSTRELGSHKGYAFSLIVELMSSVLAGLGGGFVSRQMGFHLIAYRIDAFIDVDQFKSEMDTFLRALAETPPAPGHSRVVYPGLLAAEEVQRRTAEGIPYHSEVIEWFGKIAGELGLRFEFA